MSLGNIVFIRGGGVDTVGYRRAIISADMRLHTKIPLIALLGRTHFWITTATTILRGGRSVYGGSTDHRAFFEE